MADKKDDQPANHTFDASAQRAFRGPSQEAEIHGPARLYRVTGANGNPRGAWWVTEQQMAGYIDPKTKQFDEQRWRAWTAVKSEWQPNAEKLHVMDIKAGERVRVSAGATKYQNESQKVAFMGNAQQVFVHQVPPNVKSHDIRSPQGQEVVKDVAARNPDRVGRLHAAAPQQPKPAVSKEATDAQSAIRARAEKQQSKVVQFPSRQTTPTPPTPEPPKPTRGR